MRSLKGAKAKTSLITKLLPTLVIFAVTLVSFQTLRSNHTASAACTIPSTTYGTDTITVNVPATATYYIWTDFQAPTATSDTALLSVDNGANCYNVGGDATMPLNTWTWINYQNGNHSTLISQTFQAGSHTLEYIGTQPSIAIDNVALISDPSCTPTANSGLPCTPAQTAPSVSISAPVSGATVSGSSVPITAAASDFSGVSSVAFSVTSGGTTTNLSTITSSPFTTTWNTTTVANGSYTINATATDANGLKTTTTEPVTVANNICSGNPSAPTNVKDTDTAPLPANKVSLSWTASTPATNCVMSGYYVFRTLNGTSTQVNSTPITGTTYVDTGVSASTSYTYQVEAEDTANHKSSLAPATPLAVTTGANCASGSSTLPSAPTALKQTANYYTTATITWTASTDSNGCSISGYHVYQGTTYLGDSSGTATNYTVKGLASGSSTSINVKAFDSGSNVSISSSAISVTTLKDDVAPTIPAGLAAASPSPGVINLTWSASNDLPNPGAVGVAGYTITQTAPTSATYTVTGASTTNFTVPIVSPSTKYTFEISAFDKNSNPSANSATVSVTTGSSTCSGIPSVPSGPTSPTITDSSITLDWGTSTAPANCTVSGYQVYVDHSYVTTVTGNTYTQTSLSPSTNYIFTIYAVDTAGTSSTADYTVATAADSTPPSNPTGVTVSAITPTQVELNWTASTDNVGVAGYNIYRNGGSTAYASVAGNVTSYIDTAATPSTQYTYTVQAFDEANNPSAKVASTPTSITTAAARNTTPPSIPGGLTTAITTANTVGFSWNPSTGGAAINVYNVYRNGNYIGWTTTTSYADLSQLNPSVQYNYTVVAVDANGNVSQASNQLQVTTLAAPAKTYTADFNSDGKVNVYDFSILLKHWHQTVLDGKNGDADGTGYVNVFDLSAMFTQWTG